MKIIIKTLIIAIIIYPLGYLFSSYISWELKNPFDWLINIGTYDSHFRILILLITILYFYVIYAWVSWFEYKKDMKKHSDEHDKMFPNCR
jgi:hypothetical protein